MSTLDRLVSRVPVALGLTAAAGAAVLVLPGTAGVLVRALTWLAAGAVLVACATRRPEPTESIRLLGAADLAVGAAWLLVAGSGEPRLLGAEVVQLLTVGIAGIGVATLVATPTWRRRAALLDGVVVALAGATLAPLWVGIAGAELSGTGSFTLLAAAFAAMLGPGVLLASTVTGNLRATTGSIVPVLGLLALLHAGLLTAGAASLGSPLPRAAEVSWTVVPVTGLVFGLSSLPSYRVARRERSRLTVGRLAALVALVLTPAVLTLVVGSWSVTAALVVSLVAALVLAARLAATARFGIEEARAAADVRFDALVDNAAEVLALLDDDGRLFYVSRAVQQTFHVPPGRVLGASPVQLAHPEDVEDVEALIGRARERTGVPVHGRMRLLDGEGAVRHVEVTVVDLRDVRGVSAISLTVRDVTERVTLEAELVRQARTDGLTGLVNRTVLLERVDHVLRARQASSALLFLDLDDFKLINDGYGHAAGDKVLAVLAGRLRSALRDHDTAGRVGGDEFAVLLEELGEDPAAAALQIAARVLAATSQPVVHDGEPIDVRLSIGVAVPEPGMTTAEVFAAADAAMYEAKRERRGTVVYEAGMRTSSRSRLRLMRDVRTAIDEGRLEISYQPIVGAGDRQLRGVEALLRWVHPTLGRITPDVILEHAEAAGLTADLTMGVIEAIAADLDHWFAATGRPLDVAVNLSAQQLLHVEPVEVLRRLGGTHGGVGRLTIEVTETSMLSDLTAAATVLDAFRDAGCHVAIDDFGTGYASIGYLRRLPLDELKIDQEFVDGLEPGATEGSFAAVIQGLASTLGLVTVAEGIETEAQLAAVRELGCDLVQGFLFSPALPIEDLVEWAGAASAAGGVPPRVSDRA